jgi:GTP cyclohydrolase I
MIMIKDKALIYQSAELLTGKGVENDRIEQAIKEVLAAVGEDTERQGLKRTPERVARMYEELLAGYREDPVSMLNDALFDVEYNDMIIVRDIEFYSLCEHHLLPFIGRAHVAYIPKGKVIGLSKIPRVVEMFARRLQMQERMTQQIARFLQELLQPEGVAVEVEALHLCSMMRGVKKNDARMMTGAMLGVFQEDEAVRKEFRERIARGVEPLPF